MSGNTSSRKKNPGNSLDLFPVLTEAQKSQVAQLGKTRVFEDKECVWEVGSPICSLFVVLSGAIEVFQPTAHGEEIQVVVHMPGEFTGDVDLLSGNMSVVGGRAVGVTKTIELEVECLRNIVVANSELSDVLLAAFLARRQDLLASGKGSTLILGSQFSPDTFRIREFMERNNRPFEWLDLEQNERVASLLDSFDVSVADTPVVIDPRGDVYRNPANDQLASCFGLSAVEDQQLYDVVVAGAGPAGLAAAVYAASEGLKVLVVDEVAPGGQASTSSKIENYLGFPTGISGRELAQRAIVQAEKFGATLASPRCVQKMAANQRPYLLHLSGSQSVMARSVVIATGAKYRRLPVANAEKFEGRGIYFGATQMEANMCGGEEVAIVGGGNSAGQAAVFLSQHARHVNIHIRRDSLEHTMSKYLIHRIEASQKITLHPFSEVTALHGDEMLQALEVTDRQSGNVQRKEIGHLFVFIGAAPNTTWLPTQVAVDAKGFVLTGRDLEYDDPVKPQWPLSRQPFLLETSLPGVFAAGDVRSGSTKRVASAVGEGSIAVSFIHQVLAE